MKSRILATLLCVLCMLSTLSPAATAAPASSGKLAAYDAYTDYIQDKLDTVGYLAPSTIGTSGGNIDPDRDGLIYAALADFDQDGVEELFTVEAKTLRKELFAGYFSTGTDAYWHIYSYRNGNLDLIGSDEIFLSSSADKFGLTTDGSGKPYYAQDFHKQTTFYSVSGGELTKTVLSTSSSYTWSASGTVNGKHVWVHSNTGTITGGTIDGVSVSYDAYRQRMTYLTAGGYDCYGAVTNKMRDGTPAAALSTMEAALNSYRTPSSWAKETVDAAIAVDLVPEQLQCAYTTPITRAEFCELATLLYEEISGKEITDRMSFNDTDNESVEKMGALGIVNGVDLEAGLFSPDAPLTREAAATILIRLATKLGYEAPDAAPTFADNNAISSWAKTQVGQAQAAGIMNGKDGNRFAPKESYTREQSILTIMRIYDLFN